RGPVDVARRELRDGGVSAVGAADAGTDAEPALDEVQAVARFAADAVVLHPADVRLVDAALKDQILDAAPDRVVGECRNERGVESEAALETAGNVIFAAAFPGAERPRGMNARVSGIEAQHHFSERHEIPAASLFRRNVERRAHAGAAPCVFT